MQASGFGTVTVKPMAQVVRVGFAQRGGFVPRYKVWEVDLDTLPSGEAATLAGLVYASGLLQYPPGSMFRVPGAADVTEYTFTILTATNEPPHTVTFDTPSVPEAVRPLLHYLSARSHDILADAGDRP